MMWPNRMKAFLGDIKIFLCKLNSSVSWTFKGGKLLPNMKIFIPKGNDDSGLKIEHVRRRNIGIYKCQIESDYVITEANGELELYGEGKSNS